MKTVLLSLILLGVCSANIYYTIQTSQVTQKPEGEGEEFAYNLMDAVEWAPQPDGYCFADSPSFPLENSSLCGSNQNIGWKFTFKFADAEDANYSIRFGTDFGFGAAVFVNDEFQFARTDDLWWAGNWDSNDTFVLDYDFKAGFNEVVVYGAEGCCDGQMNVQFDRNGTGYQDFSLENLQNTIPQPYPGYYEYVEDTYVQVDSRPVYEKADGDGVAFGGNLAEQFDTTEPADGYCDEVYNPTWPVENSGTCSGGNQNIVWRFVFNFYVPYESYWEWEFGTDFGRGYSIYANGIFYSAGTDDYWWAGNWDNGDVFTEYFFLSQGWNQIVLYGSEGCCDGATQVRFNIDGSEWFQPTVENFEFVSGLLYYPDYETYDTYVYVESKYSDVAPYGLTDYEYARSLVDQFNYAPYDVDGYCYISDVSYPFDNSSECGSNGDIVWQFEFSWYADQAAEYEFEFGLDFGRGFASWVNGQLYDVETSDLWWAGNWDSEDVQYIQKYLDAGYNSVTIFGSERCCDGKQSVRFSVDGGEWQEATLENFQALGGGAVLLHKHSHHRKMHKNGHSHTHENNRLAKRNHRHEAKRVPAAKRPHNFVANKSHKKQAKKHQRRHRRH